MEPLSSKLDGRLVDSSQAIEIYLRGITKVLMPQINAITGRKYCQLDALSCVNVEADRSYLELGLVGCTSEGHRRIEIVLIDDDNRWGLTEEGEGVPEGSSQHGLLGAIAMKHAPAPIPATIKGWNDPLTMPPVESSPDVSAPLTIPLSEGDGELQHAA